MPFLQKTELALVGSRVPTTPQCGTCGLYKSCHSPKMSVSGKGRLGVLILAEAPGENEDHQGIQLVGKSGKRLEKACLQAGIDIRKDCWLTNAIICRPPGNKIPENRPVVDYCRPNLVKTINELKPKMILVLGGTAIQSLIGWVWPERSPQFGVTRWAGYRIPDRKLNAWICPTYHPAHVMRAEDGRTGEIGVLSMLFDSQVKRAFLKKDRPYPKTPKPLERKVEIYPESKFAIKAVNEVLGEGPVTFAFDYETNMGNPDHPDSRIVCMSISTGIKGRTLSFSWTPEVREAVVPYLTDKRYPKIGANCFSGETEVLTREFGTVRIDTLKGLKATVLNHEGRWVPAKFWSYGNQLVYPVTFSRRNFKKTVWATSNHEWVSADDFNDRVKTINLRHRKSLLGRKLGATRVPFQSEIRTINSKADYEAGVRHGIVYGDGSKRKERPGTFRVRLCSHKEELLRYFPSSPVSYQPSCNGDPTVYLSAQQLDLKDTPPENASDSYLIGFFRGLLATDGTVSKRGGQISISGRKKTMKWCRRYLERVGYLFQGLTSMKKYDGRYSGGYERRKFNYIIYLTRETVSKEDMLLKKHRKNHKEVFLGPYLFHSLGQEGRMEEVFCATVEDGHSFTLADGLVTGNCKFEDRWTRKHTGKAVAWGPDPYRTWDCMLAAHAIDNGNGKARPVTGVKFQAYARLGVGNYSDRVEPYLKPKTDAAGERNRIHEVDIGSLLTYCGIDSLVEYELAKVQCKDAAVPFPSPVESS